MSDIIDTMLETELNAYRFIEKVNNVFTTCTYDRYWLDVDKQILHIMEEVYENVIPNDENIELVGVHILDMDQIFTSSLSDSLNKLVIEYFSSDTWYVGSTKADYINYVEFMECLRAEEIIGSMDIIELDYVINNDMNSLVNLLMQYNMYMESILSNNNNDFRIVGWIPNSEKLCLMETKKTIIEGSLYVYE